MFHVAGYAPQAGACLSVHPVKRKPNARPTAIALGSRRVRIVSFARLIVLPVVCLTSCGHAYGDGLARNLSPESDTAMTFAQLISAVCSLVGLLIAVRRSGCAATSVLVVAWSIAVVAVIFCEFFLLTRRGVVPASMAWSTGLMLSGMLTLLWYRMAARKGVVLTPVLVLLASAALIASLSLVVLRISVVP